MSKSTFAHRLKEAMERKGIKQSQLASDLNLPKSAISQYLSGKFEAKQDRLFLLSTYLNVSEPWLMGYDVPMNDEQNDITSNTNPTEDTDSLNTQRQFPSSSDIESDDLKKLYSLIRNLPPEYWDEAERYLTFLVESQKKKQQP